MVCPHRRASGGPLAPVQCCWSQPDRAYAGRANRRARWRRGSPLGRNPMSTGTVKSTRADGHWEPGFGSFLVAYVVFFAIASVGWSHGHEVGPLDWYVSVLWTLPILMSTVGLAGGIRTARRMREQASPPPILGDAGDRVTIGRRRLWRRCLPGAHQAVLLADSRGRTGAVSSGTRSHPAKLRDTQRHLQGPRQPLRPHAAPGLRARPRRRLGSAHGR